MPALCASAPKRLRGGSGTSILSDVIRRSALLLAAVLLSSACKPKYALYTSPDRDFMVNVPFAWAVVVDQIPDAFSHVNFIGPFDQRFFRGAPSFSVRWYAHRKPRPLPGGGLELYFSADDFINQTLKKVYGPEYVLHNQPAPGSTETKPCLDEPCVKEGQFGPEGAKLPGKSFIVVSAAVVDTPHFGVAEDEQGRRINPRKHEYVVLPRSQGFYVLTYPATRDGYPKHKPQFNQFVNSFRLLKDGPSGPQVAHGAALPVKKS